MALSNSSCTFVPIGFVTSCVDPWLLCGHHSNEICLYRVAQPRSLCSLVSSSFLMFSSNLSSTSTLPCLAILTGVAPELIFDASPTVFLHPLLVLVEAPPVLHHPKAQVPHFLDLQVSSAAPDHILLLYVPTKTDLHQVVATLFWKPSGHKRV